METITCLVRGPSSRYPRGFLWLVPVWFAVAAMVVAVASYRIGHQLPMWLGVTEIGALAIAAITMMGALAAMRRRAFRADAHGIWLGILTSRKRPKLRQVFLAWPEVAQLRMVSRRYGLLLEIRLSPAARITRRPGPLLQALVFLGALVMPVGFGRGRPALTSPTANPPRYLVKLCDITPGELRDLLAAIMPPALPVRHLARKSALRSGLPSRPARSRPAAMARR